MKCAFEKKKKEMLQNSQFHTSHRRERKEGEEKAQKTSSSISPRLNSIEDHQYVAISDVD